MTLDSDELVQEYARSPYFAALGQPDELRGGGGRYSAKSFWRRSKVEAAKALYSSWVHDLSMLVAAGVSLQAARKRLASEYPAFTLTREARDAADPALIDRRAQRLEREIVEDARQKAREEQERAALVGTATNAPLEELISRALEYLHSLNRLAKHNWSVAPRVYEAKTRFLDALTKAGRTTVEKWIWVHEREYGESYSKRWYVVECGKYRFHQPESTVTDSMREIAKPGEPHNPTQERRAVPEVGVPLEHQFLLVAIAAERVERSISVGEEAREGVNP